MSDLSGSENENSEDRQNRVESKKAWEAALAAIGRSSRAAGGALGGAAGGALGGAAGARPDAPAEAEAPPAVPLAGAPLVAQDGMEEDFAEEEAEDLDPSGFRITDITDLKQNIQVFPCRQRFFSLPDGRYQFGNLLPCAKIEEAYQDEGNVVFGITVSPEPNSLVQFEVHVYSGPSTGQGQLNADAKPTHIITVDVLNARGNRKIYGYPMVVNYPNHRSGLVKWVPLDPSTQDSENALARSEVQRLRCMKDKTLLQLSRGKTHTRFGWTSFAIGGNTMFGQDATHALHPNVLYHPQSLPVKTAYELASETLDLMFQEMSSAAGARASEDSFKTIFPDNLMISPTCVHEICSAVRYKTLEVLNMPACQERQRWLSVLRVFTQQFDAALAKSYEVLTTEHTRMQGQAHSLHLQVVLEILNRAHELYKMRRDKRWDFKDYRLCLGKKSADAGQQFCGTIKQMLNVTTNDPPRLYVLENWDFNSMCARVWGHLHEGAGDQQYPTKADVQGMIEDFFKEHAENLGPYTEGDGGDEVMPVNLYEGSCNSCNKELWKIAECGKCLKPLCRHCALDSGPPFEHVSVMHEGQQVPNESTNVLDTESELLCRGCQSEPQRARYDAFQKQRLLAEERREAPTEDKKPLKAAHQKILRLERDVLALKLKNKEAESKALDFEQAVATAVAAKMPASEEKIKEQDQQIVALQAALAQMSSTLSSTAVESPASVQEICDLRQEVQNLKGHNQEAQIKIESLRRNLEAEQAKVRSYEDAAKDAAAQGITQPQATTQAAQGGVAGPGVPAATGLLPGESKKLVVYACLLGNAVEAGQIDHSTGVQYCEPSPPCQSCGEVCSTQYAFCDHCDPIRNSSMHKKQRRTPANGLQANSPRGGNGAAADTRESSEESVQYLGSASEGVRGRSCPRGRNRGGTRAHSRGAARGGFGRGGGGRGAGGRGAGGDPAVPDRKPKGGWKKDRRYKQVCMSCEIDNPNVPPTSCRWVNADNFLCVFDVPDGERHYQMACRQRGDKENSKTIQKADKDGRLEDPL